jgi:hypothetical protein
LRLLFPPNPKGWGAGRGSCVGGTESPGLNLPPDRELEGR